MVNSADPLDRVFSALADGTRREVLAALSRGDRTIGELAAPHPMSLVAVSKHIGVLERAGLLTRSRRGRAHLCTLTPTPLAHAAGWLEDYERFWTDKLDALERHLTEGTDR